MLEAARGRVRVGSSEKRVRAYLDGHLVADSTRTVLVWESPHYPTYYFPAEDIAAALVPTGEATTSPSRGTGLLFDVIAGGSLAHRAATRYADSPLDELRSLIRLSWDSMSEWFEEDEPIYTHARDPFTRVDILSSSRRVRVEVDGTVVAESNHPRLLFETGLPTRYYLPLTDVRLDLLRPSASATYCPYKGTATYLSLQAERGTEPDLAWIYRTPLPESEKIAGLVSFFNERADIYVDGILQQRPGRAGA
jgi:uncharacterized protein (DUF427 family)